ncbi:MAG TPA: M23 family metallopeptidase [Candidatus Dormibacteraeota bacterium]|nr:M23 family metallopeptidase [Candidatus Dormibacteraeota bacterium]
MKAKSYTFFIAANTPGRMRKVRVPVYALHLLLALAVVGGVTVLAAVSSYSRMLWKVGNYNALRHDQDRLKKQYQQLQATVQNTNQRLDSLQSLATEVAMTYGVLRFRPTPFMVADSPLDSEGAFESSIEQFNFLKKNATAVALSSSGLRLMPSGFAESTYTPSLWPIAGHITSAFAERLDPFSGEGAFHAGVDISASYGQPIRVAADGIVTVAESRTGYGRMVIVDHGFGVSTWYGHMSAFGSMSGERVKRGQVIGYAGISGRSTGPHVHYEVRLNGAPVNPWRYLRVNTAAD